MTISSGYSMSKLIPTLAENLKNSLGSLEMTKLSPLSSD